MSAFWEPTVMGGKRVMKKGNDIGIHSSSEHTLDT